MENQVALQRHEIDLPVRPHLKSKVRRVTIAANISPDLEAQIYVYARERRINFSHAVDELLTWAITRHLRRSH